MRSRSGVGILCPRGVVHVHKQVFILDKNLKWLNHCQNNDGE